MFVLLIVEYLNLPKLAKALAPVLEIPVPEAKALVVGSSLPIRVKAYDSMDEATAALRLLEGGTRAKCEIRQTTALTVLDRATGPGTDGASEGEPQPEAEERELTLAQKLAAALFHAADTIQALELVANVGDPAVLEEAYVLADALAVPASVLEILRDRIRVLRRPQDGEPVPEEVISTASKHLEVVLTPEERAAAASAVVETTVTIAELQAEAKSKADTYKARIKLLEDQRHTQIRLHTTGKDWRDVEVITVYVPSLDRVRVVRTDTHAVVEERVPTDKERQLPLFGAGASH